MPQYDVFISHTGVDKPWVRVLADNLEKVGVSYVFDEESALVQLNWDTVNLVSSFFGSVPSSTSLLSVGFLGRIVDTSVWGKVMYLSYINNLLS